MEINKERYFELRISILEDLNRSLQDTLAQYMALVDKLQSSTGEKDN